MVDPFNPLTVPNLALTLALELLEQPVHSLPPKQSFRGAGIYAIYYLGDFEAYRKLVRKNKAELCKAPIYVGRAVREGSRKGISFSPAESPSVYKRLGNHAKSIAQTTLKIEHFRCRFLVVEDSFIDLAESVLIALFRPLWNQVVDGFGNNPTGGPRSGQRQSDWDILHPGRRRGMGKARISTHQIEKKVQSHLGKTATENVDAELQRIASRVKKYY